MTRLPNGFSTAVTFSEVYTAVAGAPGSFSTDRSMLTHGGGNAFMTRLPNGNVLYAGAWTPGGPSVRDCLVYNPTADTWANDALLSVDRRGHGVVRTAQGRTLVIGGISPGGVNYASSELYDAAPNGAACSGPGVCASGLCVDGVC